MPITTIKRAAIAGILPLLVVLLATCDVTDTKTTEEKELPEFEVTNGLQERINSANSSQKVQAGGATVQDLPVNVVNIITPQIVESDTANASNLTYHEDAGELYVGYKLTGEQHGGGIDIVDVSDVNNISDGGSISSGNLDVQEVDYNSNVEALYVAGAMSKGGSFSRLDYNNGGFDNETHLTFPGQEDYRPIIKGLVAQDASDVIFIDDKNTIYKYNTNLDGDGETQTASGDTEFRSVALLDGNVYILDQSGKIHETSRDNFNGLSEVVDYNDLNSDNAIARLQSHGDYLFAALNEAGFGVLNPTRGNTPTWNREDNGRHYVSVSAQKLDNTWRVFAASGSTIEVHEHEFNGNGGTIDQEIGEFDLSDLTFNGDEIGDAQINQVLAINGKLFVAYGSEGVVVLDNIQFDSGSED